MELEGSQTAQGALACRDVSGNVSSLQGQRTMKQSGRSLAAQAAEAKVYLKWCRCLLRTASRRADAELIAPMGSS